MKYGFFNPRIANGKIEEIRFYFDNQDVGIAMDYKITPSQQN